MFELLINSQIFLTSITDLEEWSVRSVMAEVLNCGLEINEFELLSRYYVHFQTNTLGKDMNLLIPPVRG